MGPGELDGDQTTQENIGFTQVRLPCRVKPTSCLSDFIDGVATMDVLQRCHRLDLAEGGELSRFRALGRMVAKSVLASLGSPSQPFICEGWVLGLLSKSSTYKSR
jgi:hypothetical protein